MQRDTDATGEMPVSRGYDFDDLVPSTVEEYVPHNGELDEMRAEIDLRRDTGKLPRFLVGGPTGCGKTLLARWIAQERAAPLLTIQGKYSMNESDLLGQPVIVGGETRWSDGTLTKALLASQEREVVLLVDEANRARPEAKSVLFSALDDRARVELDARGGEVIQGDPQNLIVIATINEGPGYFTERMDLAEKRRFGNKWQVDFLGRDYPEREVELIEERTPAHSGLAETMVQTANDVRARADDPTSDVRTGIPTSTALSWAQTAAAYAEANFDNPLIRAARSAVLRPFYDEDDTEADEVLQILKSRLDGAPFDPDDYDDWAQADDPATANST